MAQISPSVAIMNSDLATALDETGRIVDEALARAREELAELNDRRARLELLISKAEAVQRTRHRPPLSSKNLTLHEAIEMVLEEEGNRWMTVRELAEAINSRDLYRKKDGSKVEANQIHARTKNYAHLFEKNGPNVRLLITTTGDKT